MKKSLTHSKRILSLLMALMLAVSLVFSVAITASADTKANEEVVKVKNSVLQFNMVYEPGQSMPSLSLTSGSCFLINSTTILTCQHCVLPDENTVDLLVAAYKAAGFKNFKYDEKKLSYSVVVNGGILVSATLKNSSANDYAILTLNSTVKRDAVVLGNSSELEKTQPIYNLGYPGGVKWLQDSITYTDDKLSITNSTVSNLIEHSGMKYVQFDTAVQGGNSGGPVVDNDGNVIGICSNETFDTKFQYAVAIDQVKAALDDLAIEYESVDGSTSSDTDDNDTDDNDSDEDATTVATTEAATQVTTAAATESASGGFDAKMIIIIAIIAVVIIIVIVVILIIVNSKKKSGGNNGNGPKPPTPPTPITPPAGGNRTPPTPPTPPTIPSNEGAGETSVLGEGAGETTVLGNQSQGFTLLRKRNNEKINISKAEFVIGKERRKVDYCVSDNNSISRAHAKIKVRGGRCYISDLNSTNCTYVNGTRISPNQEVVLSKGDSVKISDEEFEFLG